MLPPGDDPERPPRSAADLHGQGGDDETLRGQLAQVRYVLEGGDVLLEEGTWLSKRSDWP